jgi:hypothetical protein
VELELHAVTVPVHVEVHEQNAVAWQVACDVKLVHEEGTPLQTPLSHVHPVAAHTDSP